MAQNNNIKRQLGFETRQLHAGQEQADPLAGARAVPIYQTTSFVFENTQHAADIFAMKADGITYTRTGNPTTGILEKRIANLEGGTEALVVASGAAATFYAIFNIAKAGDHIVSASTVYGGTYNLFNTMLPQYGIEVTFVNSDNLQEFSKAIRPNTKAIFIESLGNPNSNLIDIKRVADIAHQNNIPLIVDNTFASPFLLRPIEYGADIIIHSATKFIGGHGTTIGGVIVDSGKFDWSSSDKFPGLTKPDPSYHGIIFTEKFGNDAAFVMKIRNTLLRDTGAAISPFNSFLLLQGLETLSLRIERHVENTLKIIDFLEEHPKVEKINHPSLPDSPYNKIYKEYFTKGAGSIFTLNIKGDIEDTKRFIDSLKIFSLLVNVADSKSLVAHPATTTHSQMTADQRASIGIYDNTIRLSIGTESASDLIYDLEQALL